MPTLTIQLPGRPPVEHALRQEVITLGRKLDNTIALDDSSVSQSHARITCVGGDFSLKDLDSTNGTRLNGQSISEARLCNGDVFRLGEVVAIFEIRSIVAPLVIPATEPAPVSATKSEKSDTAVLSDKAKTTLLRSVSPGAGVVPATPTPERKSPITLVASVLGCVLAAGVVGFLVWKLAVGGTAKTTVATEPNLLSQPTPTESGPPTNASVETVEPPPAVTTPPPELPPSLAETTNAPVQQETNNLPELLTALRSPDVIERRHTAQAIGALDSGAKSAVLNLRIALVQETDLEIRMWLVVALVNNQTYDQATIPVLVEALSHESATLRQQACTSLALIPYDDSGKSTVVPALKLATEDEHEDVRKAALATLKAIAPEEAARK